MIFVTREAFGERHSLTPQPFTHTQLRSVQHAAAGELAYCGYAQSSSVGQPLGGRHRFSLTSVRLAFECFPEMCPDDLRCKQQWLLRHSQRGLVTSRPRPSSRLIRSSTQEFTPCSGTMRVNRCSWYNVRQPRDRQARWRSSIISRETTPGFFRHCEIRLMLSDTHTS